MLKYCKFGKTEVNPNQSLNKMFSCLNEIQTPNRYFTQLHFLLIGHVFKDTIMLRRPLDRRVIYN